MSLKRKISRSIYNCSSTRRWLQEWHALPGRKWVRKIGIGSRKSWSEDGEDKVLLKIARELDFLENGFYVDVGANLPTRRSNTFGLYCAGMRGLCLEPNLELAALFEKVRDEDEVVCMAVGEESEIRSFFRFNFHVYSTCSEAEAEKQLEGRSKVQATLLRSSKVPMFPLRDVLVKYVDPTREGGFFLLKADTEGFDLEVLRSNDWSKFRPACILTESTGQQSDILSFLQENSYRLAHSFSVNQLFLKEEEFSKCVELGLVEEREETTRFKTELLSGRD